MKPLFLLNDCSLKYVLFHCAINFSGVWFSITGHQRPNAYLRKTYKAGVVETMNFSYWTRKVSPLVSNAWLCTETLGLIIRNIHCSTGVSIVLLYEELSGLRRDKCALIPAQYPPALTQQSFIVLNVVSFFFCCQVFRFRIRNCAKYHAWHLLYQSPSAQCAAFTHF